MPLDLDLLLMLPVSGPFINTFWDLVLMLLVAVLVLLDSLSVASQLLILAAFIVFLLCLPVRLVLQLCCGVKLQPPPGHRPPGEADDEDLDESDRDVVIDIPPETAAPNQVPA